MPIGIIAKYEHRKMKRVGIMPTRFIVIGGNITIEATKSAYPIDDNTISVDLETKEIKRGRLNLSFETIEASGKMLANRLLDYARNGGDMTNLTPDKVFAKKSKQ